MSQAELKPPLHTNKQPRPIKVGFVGAGHIAPFHAQALQRVSSVELVAISDASRPAAEEFASNFDGVTVTDNFDAMCAEVDVVHVLTPPGSHAELSITAMRAGCDVFVEKPLASSVEECDEIIAVAADTGRTVGVDHSFLMDPFTLRAIQIVADGKLGEIVSVDCLRNQDRAEYLGGPLPSFATEGGSPWRDLGIHALYQIELFLGAIVDLDWSFRQVGRDTLLPFDEWRATVCCERGTAHIHLSWNARPLQDVIIVRGTAGTLTLDRFGMNVTLKRIRRLPEHPQRALNSVLQGVHQATQVPINLAKVLTKRIRRYHGLQEMVIDFYRTRANGESPRADLPAARRVAHWLELVAQDADRQFQDRLAKFKQPLQADTLVTGGTGFIGGHLVKRLLAAGRRIRLFTRREPPAVWLKHPQIEVILGDLGDPTAVTRAVAGTRVVYHVGGTVHGTAEAFWRGSVAGTQNVVDACLEHKVEQLIYVSSLSVLKALNPSGDLIDENWPLEPHAELRGHYTQTKLAAENYVTEAARSKHLPVVIVRPGEVIGPGAPLLSSGVGQRRGDRLIVFGNGNLTVPLIHVSDLVDALQACEHQKITDASIIHLVDEKQVSQNELANTYAKLLDRKFAIYHVPRSMLYGMGLGVQALCRLLGRTPPISVYRLRSALAPRRYDVQRAQRMLGWSPQRGVITGLQDTIDAQPQT